MNYQKFANKARITLSADPTPTSAAQIANGLIDVVYGRLSAYCSRAAATLGQLVCLYGINVTGASTITGALTVTGNMTFGGVLVDSLQALSGVGAVDVVSGTTRLTTTGSAQALTLANGTAGQIKRIIHEVDGGSAVLTPTTKTGFSTITFTAVGDSCMLEYLATRGWMIVAINGAVAA